MEIRYYPQTKGTRLTHALYLAVVDLILTGPADVRAACNRLNVSRGWYYKRRNEYDEFDITLDELRQHARAWDANRVVKGWKPAPSKGGRLTSDNASTTKGERTR